MNLTPNELQNLKLYCKVDYDFEDYLLIEMVEGVEFQICDAIEQGSTPQSFLDDARFSLAVKKQVKEEYEHRGLSADSERYPLANGVLNIIHQLRYRKVEVNDH